MGKEAKYVVRLSTEERGQLENLVARGRVAKATRQRAQMFRPPDLYGFIFGRRLTRTRCGRWGFVTGMRGGGEVAAGNKSGTFDLGKKCPLSGVRTKVPCRNHYCR